MVIEDVVEALERNVRAINESATFVLQKEIEPCSFKAFKKYRHTLWYIDRSRKEKFRVFTIQKVCRVTSEQEEKAELRELELQFMTFLFDYVRGEKFKLILGGSYEGDEQILDSDNG